MSGEAADGSPRGVGRLEVEELAAKLRDDGQGVVVLDVRRREAWAADPEGIPGACWVPLDEVPRRARDLPAEAHLVVYCS